ncbi:MAG TPA: hypothetical protein VI913_00340 [Candidatus Peribacteraceae bacterium]|nr:hypothetical protein [Candidatus Peribacteraceae bacterium]
MPLTLPEAGDARFHAGQMFKVTDFGGNLLEQGPEAIRHIIGGRKDLQILEHNVQRVTLNAARDLIDSQKCLVIVLSHSFDESQFADRRFQLICAKLYFTHTAGGKARGQFIGLHDRRIYKADGGLPMLFAAFSRS